MRVLLDTNIILDFFLERAPFADDAALLIQAHEAGRLTAYVSAITPVNLFYIARKLQGREVAMLIVRKLCQNHPVAPVNQQVLKVALDLGFKDYEDAVQHASATATGLACILTRNIKHFQVAELPVHTPTDFIKKESTLFADLERDLPDRGG